MRSPFHDKQRAIATAAEVIKLGGRFDLVAGNRNIKAKTAQQVGLLATSGEYPTAA